MARYLGKRFLAAIFTLLAVAFFTYLVFFALSPDPAVAICGQEIGRASCRERV